ncbi:MAG: FG-GAP repeat protein, partial [Deltaproteobacteria bacterium]|nr:FG-GAP repeat protein [Deltaproteobacteria bacterium]
MSAEENSTENFSDRSWQDALNAYLSWDARRAHRSDVFGAVALNRPGMRMFVHRDMVVVVGPKVEWAEADMVALEGRRDDRWAMAYRFEGLRFGNNPSQGVSEASAASAAGTHATVGRAEVIEEYANLEQGVEQRFLIPDGQPGDIRLGGRLYGRNVVVSLNDDGEALISLNGVERLSLSAPRAMDGAGRLLPCRFEIEDARIDILVEDVAVYPVYVDPVWTETGEGRFQYFGYSLSSAGDVNNDGHDDVIVGAPEYKGFYYDMGKAYVFHGSANGLPAQANWTLTGYNENDRLGHSVAGIGDVNNDGWDDVAIGIPGVDRQIGFFNYSNTGMVRVVKGSQSGLQSCGWPFPTGGWIVWASSQQSGQSFGLAVSGIGDINRDGYGDFVVGAPYYNYGIYSNNGRAFVFYGTYNGPSLQFSTVGGPVQANANFGYAVSGGGDYDGNKYPDMAIGGPGYTVGGSSSAGRARIYLMTSGGLSESNVLAVAGSSSGEKFGKSLDLHGSPDGDNKAELLVGAPGEDEAKVFTYQSINDPTHLMANLSGVQSFGSAVAFAGDVNSDGYDDVLVGAPEYGTYSGRIYLFLGQSGGVNASAVFTDNGAFGGRLGFSVARAGNVNGSMGGGEFDDFLVGAPYYFKATGGAHLYMGSDQSFVICEPDGRACDDGDACTENDTCS